MEVTVDMMDADAGYLLWVLNVLEFLTNSLGFTVFRFNSNKLMEATKAK